jgi:hypothetical protein
MPPISSRHLRARKIWIDNALRRAARCRCVTLGQRRVAAFVVVGPTAPHVQANRISRIIRLGRRPSDREHPVMYSPAPWTPISRNSANVIFWIRSVIAI